MGNVTLSCGLSVLAENERVQREVTKLRKENDQLKWTIHNLQSDLKRFKKEEFKTLKDDTHY